MNIDEFDEKLGNPYIKLKIKNLNSYKKVPLEKHDFIQDSDELKNLIDLNGYFTAFSKWVDKNGIISWKPCEILDYSKNFFEIKWNNSIKTKKVSLLISTPKIIFFIIIFIKFQSKSLFFKLINLN